MQVRNLQLLNLQLPIVITIYVPENLLQRLFCCGGDPLGHTLLHILYVNILQGGQAIWP